MLPDPRALLRGLLLLGNAGNAARRGSVAGRLPKAHPSDRCQDLLNPGKNTTVIATVRPLRIDHARGPIRLALHGLYRDGSYGVGEGIIYSYPCVCKNGDYQIVQGLPVDEFSREKMKATEQELREERASVEDLLKVK